MRILLVDDHARFRQVARAVLQHDGYVVAGEVGTAREAHDWLATGDADLVLLDLHLPDADGLETARRIAARDDAPAVIVISSRDVSDVGCDRVRAAGATGFVGKIALGGAALRAVLERAAGSGLCPCA